MQRNYHFPCGNNIIRHAHSEVHVNFSFCIVFHLISQLQWLSSSVKDQTSFYVSLNFSQWWKTSSFVIWCHRLWKSNMWKCTFACQWREIDKRDCSTWTETPRKWKTELRKSKTEQRKSKTEQRKSKTEHWFKGIRT